MHRNIKLHAFAICCISAIVLMMYMVMRPSTASQQAASPYATGERYVRIDTASWGLNCNQEITRLNANRKSDSPEKPYALAASNNVTLQLGELCNGRLVCNFNADATTLDSDPLKSCFKQLLVSYRCFSIDRLWHLKLSQGDAVEIDCNEAADADRK